MNVLNEMENDLVEAHSEWIKHEVAADWNKTCKASMLLLAECGIRSRTEACRLANKYGRRIV